uniref:Uncharacterized protein n=1 Tax=viral metagenome TaxID=1070528 RepID=A0A6M3XKG6_9ZZZZ
MKKQNKKKHNPNFLTFLVDPAKGLLSPLMTAFPTALVNAIPKVVEEMPLAVSAGAIKKATKMAKGLMYPDKPTDLGTFKEQMDKSARDADSLGTTLLVSSTLAAAIPFIQVGDAIDEIWRLPGCSAAIDIGHDIWIAPFRYGTEPYLKRYWQAHYTPLLPEPYRLADMASKNRLPDDMYFNAMAQNGLSEDWAGRWKEAQRIIMEPSVLMALHRRGVLTDKEYKAYMLWNGYNEIEANQMLHLKDVIPPLTDLIRMAVREAFGKHTYEEQKPALVEWGGKMGLTPEWVENYWYAHWERIPLGQAYENLWRGLWTKEDFMRMLRIKDFHPKDIDAIYNVSYRPPSIREMGYGFDVGAYTKEDIVRYRKWGGLSPVDSEKAATALIDYRVSAEREAFRRELMYAYARGSIDMADFKKVLAQLKTSKEAIDLWVERAQLYKERISKPTPVEEGRIVSSSEAKWAFVNGLRDEKWYRQALAELDWEEDRIQLAVDRANREMVVEEVGFRKLTATQIRDLYKFRKLEASAVKTELMKIGYSDEDAVNLGQILIDVVEAERIGKPVEPRALTVADIGHFYDMGVYSVDDLLAGFENLGYTTEDAVNKTIYTQVAINFPDLKAMYSKGWITADIMYEELVSYGLSPDRASELMMTAVVAEQPVRLASERDLTKSEIVKGVKTGVITAIQGVELLMDLGYDESESWYILVINKVVEAGDPEGYYDMKRAVEAYKKAQGKPYMDIPAEVLTLEKAVREQELKIDTMKKEKREEADIAVEVSALSNMKQALIRILMAKKLT